MYYVDMELIEIEVELTRELFRACEIAAENEGKPLESWMVDSIREYLTALPVGFL